MQAQILLGFKPPGQEIPQLRVACTNLLECGGKCEFLCINSNPSCQSRDICAKPMRGHKQRRDEKHETEAKKGCVG